MGGVKKKPIGSSEKTASSAGPAAADAKAQKKGDSKKGKKGDKKSKGRKTKKKFEVSLFYYQIKIKKLIIQPS